MLVYTERFGTIEVDEDTLIHFPEGILGFEDVKNYILIDRGDGGPIQFLQAVDDPAIAFAVIDPHTFRPDYTPELWDEDRAFLQCERDEDLAVRVILTVPQEPKEMTANLMAPIIIHAKRRIGRQVVQGIGQYSTKHRIIDELERAQRLLRCRRFAEPPVVNVTPAEDSLKQTV